MKSVARFLAFALALAAAPSAAQNSIPDEGPGSLDQEPIEAPALLRTAIAGWEAAVESENPERIAGVYTPDGWMQPPCAKLLVGRTALIGCWREILSHSPATVSLRPHTFDIAHGRDMAIERGVAQFLQNVGGLPYGINMAYVRVWRKTGGEWRIEADMFGPGGPCWPDDD